MPCGSTSGRGNGRGVPEDADFHDAVFRDHVDQQIQEVQLVGGEVLSGLEFVEGRGGGFAVEPGQTAQEQAEAAMLGLDLFDIGFGAETVVQEDLFQLGEVGGGNLLLPRSLPVIMRERLSNPTDALGRVRIFVSWSDLVRGQLVA